MKRKYIPPNSESGRRRFRYLLRQKPKDYPNKPRPNKSGFLKPIRRS